MIKKLWLQFKAWIALLWSNINVGITNLYKSPWFNLISVFIAGFASFSGWPGMAWMFIYFIGWATLAEKTIKRNGKEL